MIFKVVDSVVLGWKVPGKDRYFTMTGGSQAIDAACVFKAEDMDEAMAKAKELNKGKK
ncbi:MAG: hypothetical protein ACXAEN_21615 [Candidatus Thorarchaeota archaeon]|jgi:hypothetical protein